MERHRFEKVTGATVFFLMQISPSLSNVIARWTTARLLAIAKIETGLNVWMIKNVFKPDGRLYGRTDGRGL